MKITSNSMAAILYLLAAMVVLAIWYILLFVNTPPCARPIGSLLYFLNEPPTQLIFRWLLVLPVLCFLLAAAYSSKWSLTRSGAFSLFGVGVVLALAAWRSSPSPVAVLVSLALCCGFVVLKPHLTLHLKWTR